MLEYTPIKSIENVIAVSKVSIKNKEETSQQLRIEYLENRLKMKEKKYEESQIKIKELNQKINKLEEVVFTKQSQIKLRNQEIKELALKIKSLQVQLCRDLEHKIEQKNRNIQESFQRRDHTSQKELNKVLAKENYQLITEKNQLKNLLDEYNVTLQETRLMLKAEQQNNVLLEKLNSDLKLKIQELLFELRQANKRQEAARLYNYETDLQQRANKQNYGGNEATQSQLVDLLKLKINSLEQQLQRSQKRCKQLQDVIIGKQ